MLYNSPTTIYCISDCMGSSLRFENHLFEVLCHKQVCLERKREKKSSFLLLIFCPPDPETHNAERRVTKQKRQYDTRLLSASSPVYMRGHSAFKINRHRVPNNPQASLSRESRLPPYATCIIFAWECIQANTLWHDKALWMYPPPSRVLIIAYRREKTNLH